MLEPTLDEISCVELLNCIGKPVEVVLSAGPTAKASSVFGNIAVIDPESHAHGLLQFENKKVSKLLFVPQTSIFRKIDLSAGPFPDDACFVENTPELRAFIRQRFWEQRVVPGLSEAETDARSKKLIAFLEQNNVKYEIDESSKKITVGAVNINPPYLPDTCFSSNSVVLVKMRKMLEQCFS